MSDLFKQMCRIAYTGYVPKDQLEKILETPPKPQVWQYKNENEFLDALADWNDKYDPNWRDSLKEEGK
jgi:hypothetical protein